MIRTNIPVSLSFTARGKEVIHSFFKNKWVVKLFTYLPSFFTCKENARLILRCHNIFNTFKNSRLPVVTVYGGDQETTLSNFVNKNYAIFLKEKPKFSCEISFSIEDSIKAAQTLKTETEEALKTEALKTEVNDNLQRIGILNFANRRQPGGIGLTPYGGSQEEFLVRRSNLAWTLDPQLQQNTIHTQIAKIRKEEGRHDSDSFDHHIPYFGTVIAENVQFFDNDIGEKVTFFDVISAAAPDLRKGSDESRYLTTEFKNKTDKDSAYRRLLTDKINAIFESAHTAKIDNLVLGAFGCGCFLNDTALVAEIFAQRLSASTNKKRFNKIVFAIPDPEKHKVFRESFDKAIKKMHSSTV
jgi:uncharacterized protein (TIGR02452 family)